MNRQACSPAAGTCSTGWAAGRCIRSCCCRRRTALGWGTRWGTRWGNRWGSRLATPQGPPRRPARSATGCRPPSPSAAQHAQAHSICPYPVLKLYNDLDTLMMPRCSATSATGCRLPSKSAAPHAHTRRIHVPMLARHPTRDCLLHIRQTVTAAPQTTAQPYSAHSTRDMCMGAQ